MDKLNSYLAFPVLLLGLLVIQLRVLAHFPYFDECLHLHYLWLLSKGLQPHVDFWCTYPILGYIFTLPFFRLFPTTAYLVLELRIFNTLLIILLWGIFTFHGRRVTGKWLWGFIPFILVLFDPDLGAFFSEYSIDHFAVLPAIAAMVIMFMKPNLIRIGLIAALALLSVMFTPKYGLLLLGAGAGYYIYCARHFCGLLKILSMIAAGSAVALVFTESVFLLSGYSLWENLYRAHLFMLRYKSGIILTAAIFSRKGALFFAARYGYIILLMIAGIAAWGRFSFRQSGVAAWTGCGALGGVICSLPGLNPHFEQYLAPVILVLLLFTPYIYFLVCYRRWQSIIMFLLILVALTAGTLTFPIAVTELSGTLPCPRAPDRQYLALSPSKKYSTMKTLCHIQDLLEIIPEDEKVVGIWFGHPIFRMDETFVTYDERPTFINFIGEDEKARGYFSPDYFAGELRRNPPACVCFLNLDRNYPPGWREIVFEFLKTHQDEYTLIFQGNLPVHIRNDLLR
ncbi:MAG: hypothetical protein RAO92_04130 [Candidatus Euphemobacter frigidus]|nr:hypothetical protein [Candidatus Euphemobacter frigidus]MDP8275573.1 hypothetical protein [Candidatus Euphemobacter frigidus]